MKQKLPLFLVFILLGLLWAYSLFYIPTFDLDEALYRRIAEEIKAYQAPWRPSWDSFPLNHKPPFFYWIIIFFSRWFGNDNLQVSTTAARMPSLLSDIGILITLFFSRDFIFGKNKSAPPTRKNTLSDRWIAPLLYLSGLFPLFTGTAVIFDPLQTFLILPSLLISTRYFVQEQWKENRHLPWGTLFFWVLSLFTATILKGLNGIVIPTFAFGIQLLLLGFSRRKEGDSLAVILREGLRFAGFVFVPAVILCAIGFYGLDLKMGRAFTTEFFLVHHLGRSEAAMETHGGSIFYHPLVLFLGGGFLSSFLLFQVFEWWNHSHRSDSATTPSYVQYGFPLTFVFSFIFAFSFVATKLPHYTWPIWPALAVAGMIHLTLVKKNSINAELSRGQRFLASLPVTLLGIFFLACALNVQNLFSGNRYELIAETESARTILSEFPGFHGWAQFYLFVGAIVCLLFQRYRSAIVREPVLLALSALTTATALSFSIIPIAVSLMVNPPNEIGHLLQTKYLKGGECIWYSGPHSPTLSLAIGFMAFHNRCEPRDAVFLIVPSWKEKECAERNFTMLEKSGYLYLCGKPK
jgi:4-amino-4-deoxy-L-arabinose transferase-like glycosyltransferase